jgi:hypothetical protein
MVDVDSMELEQPAPAIAAAAAVAVAAVAVKAEAVADVAMAEDRTDVAMTDADSDHHVDTTTMSTNTNAAESVEQQPVFHGSGTYTCAQYSFTGQYDHGNMRRGHIQYANGDVYDGELLDDKFHGRGGCRYANGEHYKGQYKHGNYNGYGECPTATSSTAQSEVTSTKETTGTVSVTALVTVYGVTDADITVVGIVIDVVALARLSKLMVNSYQDVGMKTSITGHTKSH